VRALDFVTHAHATRAENAAVVVHHEAVMGRVHAQAGVAVRELHVIEPVGLGESLQIAVSVGHADRADVVPFREEQS
jgi:hypothetical protein